MNRYFFLWLPVVILAAGCATSPPPASTGIPPKVGELVPPDALVMQRGVLTARGRQFPLTGYVARSQTKGLRLVVTQNFGSMLADVLVKPDGRVIVMDAKPPLRREWVEKYLATDLRCLFGRAGMADCPGRVLGPTAFIIERRWYRLEVRNVDIKPGEPSAELFDETVKK